MPSHLVRLSKFLSLVLRHKPQTIGIELDPEGWVDVDVLLAGAAAHGRSMDRATLEEVVATNSKKRFALSEDGTRIRANQGHSVKVDLGLEPKTPPATLFHGTVPAALDSIRTEGLQKRSRHHVHLSKDRETATVVGARRGEPIILEIDAAAMHAAGHVFFLSENGVWLTDAVPAQFIRI
ncbi:MAG: RNA 2'-phosphotransferase [Planctomycetota bacterium]